MEKTQELPTKMFWIINGRIRSHNKAEEVAGGYAVKLERMRKVLLEAYRLVSRVNAPFPAFRHRQCKGSPQSL